MKKHQPLVLFSRFALAALLALLSGGFIACELGSDPELQYDAEDIAATVSDPASGLTQEIADLGAYLYAPAAGGKALGINALYALYFSGDLSAFVWNPVTRAYEKVVTDFDRDLPKHTVHIDSLFVQVRLYTSSDASGTSYQPAAGLGGGWDPAVHSLTFYRKIQGTATNLTTGTACSFTAASDLILTDIDTAARTVTINGTHERSFTRTFTSGRSVEGSVSYTIHDLTIACDPLTGVFSCTGSVDYVYDATVTRANGSVVVRHLTGTITFDGTETFGVEVEGVKFRFHLYTGDWWAELPTRPAAEGPRAGPFLLARPAGAERRATGQTGERRRDTGSAPGRAPQRAFSCGASLDAAGANGYCGCTLRGGNVRAQRRPDRGPRPQAERVAGPSAST